MQYARLYFNRSDLAYSLKLRRMSCCNLLVVVVGVGEKPRPMDSTCTSDGVSWMVLRLCTATSGGLRPGPCLKKALPTVLCSFWG